MVVKGSARDKQKTKEGLERLSYTKPHMLEPPRAEEGVFRHIHWFRMTSQPIAVAASTITTTPPTIRCDCGNASFRG